MIKIHDQWTPAFHAWSLINIDHVMEYMINDSAQLKNKRQLGEPHISTIQLTWLQFFQSIHQKQLIIICGFALTTCKNQVLKIYFYRYFAFFKRNCKWFFFHTCYLKGCQWWPLSRPINTIVMLSNLSWPRSCLYDVFLSSPQLLTFQATC